MLHTRSPNPLHVLRCNRLNSTLPLSNLTIIIYIFLLSSSLSVEEAVLHCFWSGALLLLLTRRAKVH